MATKEAVRSFLNTELRRVCEDRFLWACAAFHEALDHGHTKEAVNAYVNMRTNRDELETLYEDMRIWHRSLGHITADEVKQWRDAKFPNVV